MTHFALKVIENLALWWPLIQRVADLLVIFAIFLFLLLVRIDRRWLRIWVRVMGVVFLAPLIVQLGLVTSAALDEPKPRLLPSPDGKHVATYEIESGFGASDWVMVRARKKWSIAPEVAYRYDMPTDWKETEVRWLSNDRLLIGYNLDPNNRQECMCRAAGITVECRAVGMLEAALVPPYDIVGEPKCATTSNCGEGKSSGKGSAVTQFAAATIDFLAFWRGTILRTGMIMIIATTATLLFWVRFKWGWLTLFARAIGTIALLPLLVTSWMVTGMVADPEHPKTVTSPDGEHIAEYDYHPGFLSPAIAWVTVRKKWNIVPELAFEGSSDWKHVRVRWLNNDRLLVPYDQSDHYSECDERTAGITVQCVPVKIPSDIPTRSHSR